MDQIHETGEELVDLIGEPDKPELEKTVEDVDSSWTKLNNDWAERQAKLDDALRQAMNFQDELMVRSLVADLTTKFLFISLQEEQLAFIFS